MDGQEPKDDNPRPNQVRTNPNIIVLDDSGDDSVPSAKAPVSHGTFDSAKALISQGTFHKAQATIKSKPSESARKFQNVPRKRGQDNNESATKKLKLQAEAVVPSSKTDSELLRLKEEEEDLEGEELAAAQRLAELLQRHNERNAINCCSRSKTIDFIARR